MSGFTEKKGVLHVDNVPLPRVAEQFGTPCYVYSAAVITAQYNKLKTAMKKALPAGRQPMLCYACKASSNIAILHLLKGLGSGLEIVSEGELVRGLKAGFDANRIVSTGVGKQKSEIKAALQAGIHQFNIESLPELERIGAMAAAMKKTAPVVFRFNPDVKGGGHNKTSTGRKHDKFGMNAQDVFAGFERAKKMKYVQALGLSMHIGSQVFTVSSFKTAFERLPALVKDLRAAGNRIERLDIGGGFPIQYKDEILLDLDAYAKWVRDIIVPLETEIILEPGRFLVGNAGVLLTEIAFVKENRDRHFIILDAAMNDLIRPTLYEAWHGIEPVAHRKRKKKKYDVVGPVCETGDTFAIDRSVPEVREGELMVIRSAGAYGACMASNYNTRPLAPEILVDGHKIRLIRKRQTIEEIIEGESI